MLEEVVAEESEAFENMPEGLQMGERGEQSQAAVSQLEEAINSIDEVVAGLEEITM